MKYTYTSREYTEAFERERASAYPAIDAFERRVNYAIDRDRLEIAARVLACPVKRNPPNWQHGRIIYSRLRQYLAGCQEFVSCFDCGTAKGFSALCMAFALHDAGDRGVVNSVDVVDPQARVARNSVAELEELKTVTEFVAPWSEASIVNFSKMTGTAWLIADSGRVHFAFIDGKHRYREVRDEAELLARRQQPGDVAIFDDLQIADVERAVMDTRGYQFETLAAKPERRYAIATRL